MTVKPEQTNGSNTEITARMTASPVETSKGAVGTTVATREETQASPRNQAVNVTVNDTEVGDQESQIREEDIQGATDDEEEEGQSQNDEDGTLAAEEPYNSKTEEAVEQTQTAANDEEG